MSEATGGDLATAAAEPMPASADAVSEFPRGGRIQTRTCAVTAIYRLSEQGRKASLLDGGDGRAVQEIKVQVPTNRFHLVSVDAEGHAQLRLFPRYYLNEQQEVIRDSEPPIFDTVPSVDDLLKEAARNHQLERAYRVERADHRRKQRESQFDAHQRLAERFLADPSLRALPHPKPTSRKCYFTVGPGQTVVYDAKRDVGIAPRGAAGDVSALSRGFSETIREDRRNQGGTARPPRRTRARRCGVGLHPRDGGPAGPLRPGNASVEGGT
ncbi:MAG: hypothetical protein ACRD2X_07805 [Vicinamibacteraceae bacterium]